jgi:Protein of unknown function (DUF3285)
MLNLVTFPFPTIPNSVKSTEPEILDVPPDLTLQSPVETAIAPPKGSYVKHAMRNMVRKRGKSLQHFFLSTVGMLALFIGLAYITR